MITASAIQETEILRLACSLILASVGVFPRKCHHGLQRLECSICTNQQERQEITRRHLKELYLLDKKKQCPRFVAMKPEDLAEIRRLARNPFDIDSVCFAKKPMPTVYSEDYRFDALYTACKALWGGSGNGASGNRANGNGTNGNGTSPKTEKFDFPEGLRLAQQRDLHAAEAAKYLKERGITLEVAQKLGWGFTKTFLGQERDAMMMPHILNDKLVGVKYKSIAPKEFSQVPGSSIGGLYARGLLDPNADSVFLFEGPDDVALAMSYGYNATGLIAATSPLDSVDVAMLKRYKRVFLVGDQDKVGREAMDRIAKKLDVRQVIRVQLPVKDIGDLYKQAPESFAATMQQQIREAQAPAQVQIAAPVIDVPDEIEETLPEYPEPTNDLISECARAVIRGTTMPLGHVRESLKVVVGSMIGDGRIEYPGYRDIRALGYHFNLGDPQSTKSKSFNEVRDQFQAFAETLNVFFKKLSSYGSKEFLVKGLSEEPHQLLYVPEGNELVTANENFPGVFSKLTDAYDEKTLTTGSFKNSQFEARDVELASVICQTRDDFTKTFGGRSAIGGGGLARWTITFSPRTARRDWYQDMSLIEQACSKIRARVQEIRSYKTIVRESPEAKKIRLATFESFDQMDKIFSARLDDIYRREILLAAVFAPTVKSGLPVGEFMGFPVIEAEVTAEMAEFARKLTLEHQYELRQTLWPNDAGSNVEKMEIAMRNWLSKRCHQSDRSLMQAAHVYRPGSGGTEAYKRAKRALAGQGMKCTGVNRKGSALYCASDCPHGDAGWKWQ